MKKFTILVYIFLFTTVFTACDDDELALPDLTVSFTSSNTNIAENEEEITVNITFSRAVTLASQITLNVTELGLIYGEDYTSSPAINNGTLVLDVPINSTSASFTLTKVRTSFVGDESLQFDIASLSDDLFKGENQSIRVNFTEVVATKGTLDPTVGGANQPNTVYIDLSSSRQTAVVRSSWDLGFYSAGDEFNVIINPHVGALIQSTGKNGMNEVAEEDSIGLTNSMSFDAFNPFAIGWTDHPSGAIDQTAIAEISATDSDNEVYILNRGVDADGNDIGWQKIRILRSGNGYVLQYADLNASTFNEITISKDNDYNFTFFHLENGKVAVEPQKDRWDLAFSAHHTHLNFGGGNIPYLLKDMVFHNRTGVRSIMLDEATYGTYENFDGVAASNITLAENQIEIGSTWRDVFTVSVFDDRFYLIQDADGHLYKLRFDRMALNGERGFPQFSYELLNEG